jgi:ABC-2 type transport system ATP-binding protein
MSDTVLSVTDVCKRFASVTAVDDVSFEVRRGEVFALLGPNGAGKTTTARMLTGILRPDSGSIVYSLDGTSAGWPAPRRLGYLPEDRGLYQDLPVLRTLAYFGILRGMRPADARDAARRWLGRVGLADRAGARLETLSRGNQQKVQIVAAILHGPDFAVLDEPFTGLDPMNQEAILEILHELRSEGMTVVLSAHQMDLVERVVDRVLLLHRGHAILEGTLAQLRAGQRDARAVRVRTAAPAPLERIRTHPSLEEAAPISSDEIRLLARPGASLSEILVLIGESCRVVEIRSEEVRLHDIYVRAVRSAGTGREGGME